MPKRLILQKTLSSMFENTMTYWARTSDDTFQNTFNTTYTHLHTYTYVKVYNPALTNSIYTQSFHHEKLLLQSFYVPFKIMFYNTCYLTLFFVKTKQELQKYLRKDSRSKAKRHPNFSNKCLGGALEVTWLQSRLTRKEKN